MLITITGKAGSGKSTVAKALAQKLGYEYISIGEMKRKIAKKMGINIFEFNKLGERLENQHEFDLKYEEYQKNISSDAKIILESRLGFFCQPKSFKIFLTIDDKEAAKRIFNDKRATDHYTSWKEVYTITQERNKQDLERYFNLYGVYYQDLNNFDCIVDTTEKSLDQTLKIILEAIDKYFISH